MSKHPRWLVVAISVSEVRWFHWARPEARHTATYNKVTARVQALVDDGLATVPAPEYPGGYSLVELTDAGRAWLADGAS